MRGNHTGSHADMGTRPGMATQWTTTQTEAVQADGSVDVTLTSTNTSGTATLTRMVSLAESDTGSFSITSTRHHREIIETITADTDGGVDITRTTTTPGGTEISHTLDLDLNESGALVITETFTGNSGNTSTRSHTMALENFLGEAGEALTVSEVTEALLEKLGVDITLTGIADLLA